MPIKLKQRKKFRGFECAPPEYSGETEKMLSEPRSFRGEFIFSERKHEKLAVLILGLPFLVLLRQGKSTEAVGDTLISNIKKIRVHLC